MITTRTTRDRKERVEAFTQLVLAGMTMLACCGQPTCQCTWDAPEPNGRCERGTELCMGRQANAPEPLALLLASCSGFRRTRPCRWARSTLNLGDSTAGGFLASVPGDASGCASTVPVQGPSNPVFASEQIGRGQIVLPAGRSSGRIPSVCYLSQESRLQASFDELQLCRRLPSIKEAREVMTNGRLLLK